jgi:hypothetical protein
MVFNYLSISFLIHLKAGLNIVDHIKSFVSSHLRQSVANNNHLAVNDLIRHHKNKESSSSEEEAKHQQYPYGQPCFPNPKPDSYLAQQHLNHVFNITLSRQHLEKQINFMKLIEDLDCSTSGSIKIWDLIPRFLQTFLINAADLKFNYTAYDRNLKWDNLPGETRDLIKELIWTHFDHHVEHLSAELQEPLVSVKKDLIRVDFCFDKVLLKNGIHDEIDNSIEDLLNGLLNHELDNRLRAHFAYFFIFYHHHAFETENLKNQVHSS